MDMADLLDKLNQEDKFDINHLKIDAKEKGLADIIALFETNWDENILIWDFSYEEMCVQIKKAGIKYNADQVSKFSIFSEKYQTWKNFNACMGYFFSALVDCCSEDNITIYTKNLEKLIDYLGYKNSKNFIIIGSVGDYICRQMVNGSVSIHGNTRHSLGFNLRGGFVHVFGDVTDFLGNEMFNGSIIVDGNAGQLSGSVMRGGSIKIKGNAGSRLSYQMGGGSITVNGNAGDLICYKVGVDHTSNKNYSDALIYLNGEYGSIFGKGYYHSYETRPKIGKIYHKNKLICERGLAINPDDFECLHEIKLLIPKK